MTSNNDLLSSLNKIFIKIVKDGNVELVEDFIKLGVDVNRNEVHYWASRNGHLAVVECLITNGIDIQYDDNFLLRNAAFYGSLNIVEYLINNGAENEFVLCTASERGHLDIVKYLISHNADIHVNNDRAFRYALLYNQLEVVKYLVANGANVNADKDFTLIWASMNSHLDVVEYLKRIMNRM